MTAQRSSPRECFILGVTSWAMYAVPFQIIGAVQFLMNPPGAPMSVWQMSFAAGGCCIMPLVLLLNLFWIRRSWSASNPWYSIVLTALMVVSIGLSDGILF